MKRRVDDLDRACYPQSAGRRHTVRGRVSESAELARALRVLREYFPALVVLRDYIELPGPAVQDATRKPA